MIAEVVSNGLRWLVQEAVLLSGDAQGEGDRQVQGTGLGAAGPNTNGSGCFGGVYQLSHIPTRVLEENI